MEKVDVLVVGTRHINEDFVKGLEDNKQFINKVFCAGDKKPKVLLESDIPCEFIECKEKNKAIIRNLLLDKSQSSNSAYVLFINSSTLLEEMFIEELLDEMLNNEIISVVYPNVIKKFDDGEKITNFTDIYENETELLTSLSIESYLPEWGVLCRKDIFNKLGNFNGDLEDFEFYEFIYKNIKNLKLKLAELSFVTECVYDTFIDTSYRSYVIREIVLKKYDWQLDLFPNLSWSENEKLARATALTLVADRLASYYDYFNASNFLMNSLKFFHNQTSLRKLIDVKINMGLFSEAEALIVEGISDAKEKGNLIDRVKKLSTLIVEVEKAVDSGKIAEVLYLMQELSPVYLGAPIYNILGVVNWVQNNIQDSYKFFYKAVTMNPLNEDYLFNCLECARTLNLEEDVKKLLRRLLVDVL